jgi:predicted nuclease of predicted toxin-antitoxin system
MRIKLDENLPQRLEPALVSLGHDVDTVAREGLQGCEDERLWPEVQAARRFLITRDLDFSDERRFPPGSHAGILVLRLSDDRSQAVTERLSAVFASESIETWASSLVIVTDHKVRVRRP